MPQAFRKAAHRKLRRAIRGLPGRGDDAEDRGEVDDMRLALLCEMRQERAGAVHHAPEIDVDQPLHLRLIDFVEGAEQGDAGIVDDDVERGVGGNGRVRKILDLRGLADIDAMRRNLARASLAGLGGDLLQAGLVAVGKRQVAAARGQLQRKRATDAAGGAGHGGRTFGYFSHWGGLHAGMKKAGGFRNFRKLEPNHKAVSAINVDYPTESSIANTT